MDRAARGAGRTSGRGADGMGIEIDGATARLLAEIGFLGISRGLTGPSEVVFAALARLRPQDEVSAIGRALVALAQDAPDRAVAALRAVPQSEAVLAFRCVAHARLGERAEAEELLAELEVGGAPAELVEIGRGALAAAQASGLPGRPARSRMS